MGKIENLGYKKVEINTDTRTFELKKITRRGLFGIQRKQIKITRLIAIILYM